MSFLIIGVLALGDLPCCFGGRPSRGGGNRTSPRGVMLDFSDSLQSVWMINWIPFIRSVGVRVTTTAKAIDTESHTHLTNLCVCVYVSQCLCLCFVLDKCKSKQSGQKRKLNETKKICMAPLVWISRHSDCDAHESGPGRRKWRGKATTSLARLLETNTAHQTGSISYKVGEFSVKTCVSGDSDQRKGRLRAKPNKFAGSLWHISWTRKKGTEIARELFETKTNHLKKKQNPWAWRKILWNHGLLATLNKVQDVSPQKSDKNPEATLVQVRVLQRFGHCAVAPWNQVNQPQKRKWSTGTGVTFEKKCVLGAISLGHALQTFIKITLPQIWFPKWANHYKKTSFVFETFETAEIS